MIELGQELCSDPAVSGRREWLVTNGRGGYASGTVAGFVTRPSHGLLVVRCGPSSDADDPGGRQGAPGGQRTLESDGTSLDAEGFGPGDRVERGEPSEAAWRTILLSPKLDEVVEYDGCEWELGANRWADGAVAPRGFLHLHRFHLEGSIPVWTFTVGDALLERRIWMEHGADITFVQYRLRRARLPVRLRIHVFANCRSAEAVPRGSAPALRVEEWDGVGGVGEGGMGAARRSFADQGKASEEGNAAAQDHQGADREKGAVRAEHVHGGTTRTEDASGPGAGSGPGEERSARSGPGEERSARSGPGEERSARSGPGEEGGPWVGQGVGEGGRDDRGEGGQSRLRVWAGGGEPALVVATDGGSVESRPTWYRAFRLAEASGGGASVEDHLRAGVVRLELPPGGRGGVVLSTSAKEGLPGTEAPDVEAARIRRRDRDRALLVRAGVEERPAALRQLVLAADHFLVDWQGGAEVLPGFGGAEVLPGYGATEVLPGFGAPGGRPADPVIAVPGLTLTTGRTRSSEAIIRERLSAIERKRSASASSLESRLWLVEALRAHHRVTEDDALVEALLPGLERGVADAEGVAEDGGLVALEDGRKPVALNALRHHALRTLEGLSRHVGRPGDEHREAAGRAGEAFDAFWNEERGACFASLGGPDGPDATIRPEQVLAVSLLHTPLSEERRRRVVDSCARKLLSPFGLREWGVGPSGSSGGSEEIGASEQEVGSLAEPWLLAHFALAHRRVYGDSRAARSLLAPLFRHLRDHGVGGVSAAFHGSAPYQPIGAPWSAVAVGSLLSAWRAVAGR